MRFNLHPAIGAVRIRRRKDISFFFKIRFELLFIKDTNLHHAKEIRTPSYIILSRVSLRNWHKIENSGWIIRKRRWSPYFEWKTKIIFIFPFHILQPAVVAARWYYVRSLVYISMYGKQFKFRRWWWKSGWGEKERKRATWLDSSLLCLVMCFFLFSRPPPSCTVHRRIWRKKKGG